MKGVAIGIVWRDGAVLVGRRRLNDSLAGYDEFPGGKIEPGETPEIAVVREVLEETGLFVSILARRAEVTHPYSHGVLRLTFFDCLAPGDRKPKAPFRWRTVKELADLRFPEANRGILESLLANDQPPGVSRP